MYYVYVLKSKNYNQIYIGFSDNSIRRLNEHNSGKTKSTKFYKPYKIIYQEKYKTRIEARKREKFLKSGCGREWIKNNFMGL